MRHCGGNQFSARLQSLRCRRKSSRTKEKHRGDCVSAHSANTSAFFFTTSLQNSSNNYYRRGKIKKKTLVLISSENVTSPQAGTDDQSYYKLCPPNRITEPWGENYHLRFSDISLWRDKGEEMETGSSSCENMAPILSINRDWEELFPFFFALHAVAPRHLC